MPLVHTKGWAIIDTETTHIDEILGEIIEVAILTSSGHRYHTKIKPQHIETANPKALEINGYNEEAWADAVHPGEAVAYIGAHLLDRTIVGHNPAFDMRHLREFYSRLDAAHLFKDFDRRLIDTTTLAYEHLVPHGLERTSLHAICDFLGISNEGAHTAMRDVERTHEVFRRLCRPSSYDRHIGFRLCGGRYRRRCWLRQGGGPARA